MYVFVRHHPVQVSARCLHRDIIAVAAGVIVTGCVRIDLKRLEISLGSEHENADRNGREILTLNACFENMTDLLEMPEHTLTMRGSCVRKQFEMLGRHPEPLRSGAQTS